MNVFRIGVFTTMLLLLFAGCGGPPADQRDSQIPVASDDGMYAVIQTSKGEIRCQLAYDKVPLTVANFVGLAEGAIENNFKPLGQPYFDGIGFHRVIPDFMIQTGDPNSTDGDPGNDGMGGPGYNFRDEFHPDLKHTGPGILSMANSGPSTNGSQFFITHVETPWLDNKHSVFGHVVKGQSVVDAIQQGDQIVSIRIERVGATAQAFDAAAIAQQNGLGFKPVVSIPIEEFIATNYPDAQQTPEGVYYVVKQAGTGATPQEGQTVQAFYTGKLQNGTQFDSNVGGNALEFTLGMGQVIPGWEIGFSQLNVGSKATFIIPPDLAYGANGFPPVIPSNAVLVFDVELAGIK